MDGSHTFEKLPHEIFIKGSKMILASLVTYSVIDCYSFHCPLPIIDTM
jgi:hypothetical protein